MATQEIEQNLGAALKTIYSLRAQNDVLRTRLRLRPDEDPSRLGRFELALIAIAASPRLARGAIERRRQQRRIRTLVH